MTDWNAWYDREIRPTVHSSDVRVVTDEWEDGFDSRPIVMPDPERPLSAGEKFIFAMFLVVVVAIVLLLGWCVAGAIRDVVTFVTMYKH